MESFCYKAFCPDALSGPKLLFLPKAWILISPFKAFLQYLQNFPLHSPLPPKKKEKQGELMFSAHLTRWSLGLIMHNCPLAGWHGTWSCQFCNAAFPRAQLEAINWILPHVSTSHHKTALSHVAQAREMGSSLSDARFIICLLSFISTVLHCHCRTILEAQSTISEELWLIQDKAAYSIPGQRRIN